MSNSLRRFRPRFETLEAREVLAAYMDVSLKATDLSGAQITSVAAGQAFNIQVWVEDLRPIQEAPYFYVETPDGKYSGNAKGVSSAYVDLIYNSAAFDFNSDAGPTAGPGSPAINAPVYDIYKTVDGAIEELGAFQAGLSYGNGDPRLWITVPMIAEQNLGQFTISAQNTVDNEGFAEFSEAWTNFVKNKSNSLLDSGPTALTPEEVRYTNATITLTVVEPGLPVDIDLRIVRTPTAVNGSGELSMLPENAAWLDEWDQFYVEIYATAPTGADLKSVTVTIDFTNEFHNAKTFIGAGQDSSLKFAVSNTTYRNDTSFVTATFTTPSTGLGDNNTPALLGRIYFGPELKIGNGVDYDASGGYAQPEITDFVVSSGQATVRYNGTNEVTGVTVGSSAETDLWAVPYDLDDDGSITLTDLTQVIRKIGTQVSPSNNLYALDFTHNGFIDLSDISMLIKNIGTGVTQLSPRRYYTGFPFDNAPAMMGIIEGESVGDSMLLEGELVSSSETSQESGPASAPVLAPISYPLVMTDSTTNTTKPSSTTESDEQAPAEEVVATNFVTSGSDLQTMLIIEAAENSSSEDLSTDSEAVDELFADLDTAELHLTM